MPAGWGPPLAPTGGFQYLPGFLSGLTRPI